MTRTQISVNLHDTAIASKCERVVAGKIPEYVATLRWDSTEVELFGSLDDIDDALEQLAIDSARLRQQQDVGEAAS